MGLWRGRATPGRACPATHGNPNTGCFLPGTACPGQPLPPGTPVPAACGTTLPFSPASPPCQRPRTGASPPRHRRHGLTTQHVNHQILGSFGAELSHEPEKGCTEPLELQQLPREGRTQRRPPHCSPQVPATDCAQPHTQVKQGAALSTLPGAPAVPPTRGHGITQSQLRAPWPPAGPQSGGSFPFPRRPTPEVSVPGHASHAAASANVLLPWMGAPGLPGADRWQDRSMDGKP